VEAEPAEVGTARHREQSAENETAPQQETAAPGAPTRPASSSRQYWKLSGITALVSGGLMLLCIVLPQQWGGTTYENDQTKAIYLLYLGLVVLGLGTLVLLAGWRIQGLGALIGASIIGTVVLFDMVNTLDQRGLESMQVGFWVGFVAPVVLVVAGGLALVGARHETDMGFAALSRADWASWCVVGFAVAGALTLLPLALETYSSDRGWGLQGLWLAVLALWVPVAAVFARPALLGRWALLGWCLACAAPVLATWLVWEEQESTSRGMWFVLLTLVAMAGLAPMVHRDRRLRRGA
jgi:hypothetical protein